METIDVEIISRARNLAINEYPRDPRDCIRQAVKELVTNDKSRDVCRIFDITVDEYLTNYYDSLYQDYLKLICKELNIMWNRKLFGI